jgi:hypothetical protein
MPRLVHRILVFIGLGFGFAGAFTVGRAAAQDNFDANKTPAQLFANDCSGCHKSPAGLSKVPGMFGVESFLREHYTASRQAAAAIAGYLRAVDAEQPAAPSKRGKSEPRRKADKKKEAKSEAKAKTEAKPETKPETKIEPKVEAKSEAKSEPKPESKPEAKVEAKPASEKPPAEKPADKPEKSD